MGRKKTTIQEDVAKLVVIGTFLLFLINPEKTKIGIIVIFVLIVSTLVTVYFLKTHKQKIKRETITEKKVVKVPQDVVTAEQFKNTKTIKELWTIEFLKSIDWKRYEELCEMFLELKGYKAEVTKLGADGGIDINIYERNTPSKVYAIAQCKSFTTYKIGVKSIRELYGVMSGEKINYGFFFTTSSYTEDAIKFAKGKHIHLVTGKDLIDEIHQLDKSHQDKLYEEITLGDYKTPSCPKCGYKMKLRTNKKDRNKKFWGCRNYPKCRSTIKCNSIETRDL